MKHAQEAYTKASSEGGSLLASATSYLTQATGDAKDTTFDTWSHSDLKAYLDSYGIPVYQGSTLNELRAAARRNAEYFRYGTSNPQDTLYAKLQDATQWLMDQLKIGASSGRAHGQEAAGKVKEKAKQAEDQIRGEL